MFIAILCSAVHGMVEITRIREENVRRLQEKVLDLQSKAGVKRYPSTFSHFSGIQRYYESSSKN